MLDTAELWPVLCRRRRGDEDVGGSGRWRLDGVGGLVSVGAVDAADLVRDAQGGVAIDPERPATAAAHQLAALFGPLVLRPATAPLVLAHLGQSVDGRIATASGHSHYIGGDASLEHLHRLRAVVDVVLIGTETACLDRPRLTVRRVAGENPVRGVIDPRRRLPADSPVLTDGLAPTLVLTADGTPRRLTACAETVPVPTGSDGRLAPAAILAALAARGLTRVLVEGGGGTVSRFLAGGCLQRLQLAVAPLIIGSGRPVLSLPVIDQLGQALRPRCRIWPLGSDVLFDFCLDQAADDQGGCRRNDVT